MKCTMEVWTLILCVIPSIVTSITVSSNGNSPEIKMIHGMMMDAQNSFTTVTIKPPDTTTKSSYGSRKLNSNLTKLSINERYRRLIPYMTFYYANDIVSSTTEHAKNIEVEKAEIIETKTIQQQSDHRQSKKIVYPSNRNIPIYQGNRLTQYNIASANPTKYLYKEVVSAPQTIKGINYNPLLTDHRVLQNTDYDYERIVQKPILKAPSVPFSPPTRKPYLNFFDDESSNVRYYIPEKEQIPKYKLIPYEQTPPVKVLSSDDNIFRPSKPQATVPLLIPKEQVYIKQRPAHPQYIYQQVNSPHAPVVRKPPAIVSENYYEKRRPYSPFVDPIIESGFKPITTETPAYESPLRGTPNNHFQHENQEKLQVVEVSPQESDVNDYNPDYYQYVSDKPTYETPTYVQSNSVTLADLLNSLQLNKSIPKPITRENVGASIRTLLQVLNALKALPQQEESPVLSTPKSLIHTKFVQVTDKPEPVLNTVSLTEDDTDLHDEPYLAPVNTPSQHLDDLPPNVGTSQRFPLPIASDDEGGTPGRPGIDYPTMTTIPQTAFNCKTQRYKGFFADPETRCQVWHYCDLNGGQASFLCPNGTIFSQAALTCDWWFNVRCASTAQLYVLNESLYKYILPHSPKFPEDYSGPLVDKYLTLKFKEMEEQFRKNKNKQSVSEKMDSAQESSTEDDKESSSKQTESDDLKAVSEASVIVDSPGTSGNVERLHDK